MRDGFGAGVTGSRRLLAPAGLTGVVLLAVTACGGGGGGGGGALKAADTPAPKITITPADGTGKAKPEDGVQVTATDGTLDTVSVQVGGKDVPGALSADKTSWKSTWTLTPSAKYTVSATAHNGKKTATASSGFSTLKPSSTLRITSVVPNSTTGKTVGVGMPIIVNFNRSVTGTAAKKAVEKALVVKSEKSSVGAWYWYTDSEVIFRTAQYWEPHQTVNFTAHLSGVKSGNAYGTTDTTLDFKIGHSRISKVSTTSHRMKVYDDGKMVKNVGISAGRGGEYKYYTTSGIHLTMEAESPVTMTSPGLKKGDPGYYSETVYDAVRISNSGEYVHSAPWSVGSQGYSNVSHGCVNASPAFAKWFYSSAEWGDPVIITGTPRPLEFDNGFGWWQKPWKSWVKGSAGDTAVDTATGLSVDPSATPSASASTPTSSAPATPGLSAPSTTATP